MIPAADSLQEEIDAVRDEARREGLTLFGAGGFARAVHRALQNAGIPVHAFVVTGRPQGPIDGVPVVTLDEMAPALIQLPMWIAVFNRHASSNLAMIASVCSARGITSPRLPQEYFELVQERMGWRYWLADRRRYVEHRADIESTLGAVEDDDSRRQLAEALRFRVAPAGCAAPLPSGDAQYFPEHVVSILRSSGPGLVFIDAGAYDGDTLGQAAHRLNVAAAFAFEPDPVNFLRLAQNVRSLEFPVACIPCGLSRTNEWLSFSVDQGEASAVGEQGAARIQCVSIDQCLGTQRIDYIKLDVEGHELPALEGALATIERFQPAFAVAAYHRWDDLWQIPEFFRRHAPGYRITYRAHEFNTFDGVFYAVRK